MPRRAFFVVSALNRFSGGSTMKLVVGVGNKAGAVPPRIISVTRVVPSS